MKRFLLFLFELRALVHPFSKITNIDVLLASADPNAPLDEKVSWLQDVVDWLRSPIAALEKTALTSSGRIQTVRVRFLLHLLDRNPEWKLKVAAVLRSVLTEASGLHLFGSIGLSSEDGFFSEIANRVMRKLLPSPADERDLGAFFHRIFRAETDPEWIESLPPEIFSRIHELIRHGHPDPETIFRPLRHAMAEALMILGPNIAALGLSEALRSRMSDSAVGKSPFRELDRRLQDVAERLRRDELLDPLANPLVGACEPEIRGCRAKIVDVYQHLEEAGVSVAIVFQLESLAAALLRVETLLTILAPHPSVDRLEIGRRFLALLVRQSLETTGLRHLLATNMDMIARKVVERVGMTGEHYITTNRSEYWAMLRSSAGGGLVTVFTTVIKFWILKLQLPLFFEGLFSALNYAGSFLIMQGAHFSLATKQPSMTASTLANKLRLLSHRRHLQEFVDEVARITRSQFAAALGNVGLVVPGALLFDWAFRQFAGRPMLSAAYAEKTILSLDPFSSLTVPAAAITGVLLWLSAITGGWVENWAVFRRLPEAIASHQRLRSVFGIERTEKFALGFRRQIATITSNIAIGVYLAFTPVVGRFFGAPLDIRHVTLSSGSLTFSVSGLGWANVDGREFALACLGILLILVLNFGVSFALALFVALRARRIKRAWVYHLIRAVAHRLRTRGRFFFFPPRDAAVDPPVAS